MESFLAPDLIEGATVEPPPEEPDIEPEPEPVQDDEQEIDARRRLRDEEIEQDRAETQRLVAEAVHAAKKQAYRERLRQREQPVPVKPEQKETLEPEQYENPFVQRKGETQQTQTQNAPPEPNRSGPTVLGRKR